MRAKKLLFHFVKVFLSFFWSDNTDKNSALYVALVVNFDYVPFENRAHLD